MRNNETATVTISSTATSNTNSFVTASGSISIAGTINSGTVIEADLLAVDGVLHKIDSVVEPIFFSKYLLDTALDAGLTTFLALVDLVPGLADIINSGDYTLLAPTDDAFLLLDPDTITFLTNPDNVAILNATLLYHVIPEVITSFQFVDGPLGTLQGDSVDVSVNPRNGLVESFNENTVDQANLLAINGIMHTLNGVLVLPGDIPTPTPITPVPSPRLTQSPFRSTRNPVPTSK